MYGSYTLGSNNIDMWECICAAQGSLRSEVWEHGVCCTQPHYNSDIWNAICTAPFVLRKGSLWSKLVKGGFVLHTAPWWYECMICINSDMNDVSVLCAAHKVTVRLLSGMILGWRAWLLSLECCLVQGRFWIDPSCSLRTTSRQEWAPRRRFSSWLPTTGGLNIIYNFGYLGFWGGCHPEYQPRVVCYS